MTQHPGRLFFPSMGFASGAAGVACEDRQSLLGHTAHVTTHYSAGDIENPILYADKDA
jgi:hypothetical protein